MEFSKIYNRDEFLNFLRRDFLPDDFSQLNEPVVFATKTTYSKQATKLGICKSLDLVVYEIRHSGKDDPRVGLSKEAFRMLSEEWQSRALVLFVPETNANNYRFSLIEIKLEGDQTSAKVHRKYSNPRRYSYVLGEGIGGYTPNKYLAKGKILENNEKDLLERFSVEVLTKAFYNELSDWYAWAIDSVEFPGEQLMDSEDRRIEHRSKNVIRLLTRLLFVWFLKQKSLIPWQLFDENYLSASLLKDFAPNLKIGLFKEKSQESRYYRAILQNLFFATLNCPITPQSKEDSRERGFRKSDWYGQGFGEDHLMRYESEFKNAKHFLELVNERVPFLNGGLFDCLDDKQNKIYIDGFSDNLPKPNRLTVPDFLFFGESQGKGQDVSAFYGDKKKKSTDILGLVDILKKYNFTIEENTPFDQEVSLDPELLGKVFENLLASYNPETKTTARKQTGSFYTPREIVQYMVDESLVAHLKHTVGDELEEKYRKLMQYTDEDLRLTDAQKSDIVRSLQNCKVLDPACGSGAFPVGVLQQMVHILSQLDPRNEIWKELILEESVHDLGSTLRDCTDEERKEVQDDINRNFDDSINRPDYARKLYLIEKCIYGVDIQSIAVQISKLRFFISLVVDQKPTSDRADNFGIRPLPNLEAKFVAANTLIGLKKDKNLFDNREIDKLQAKLTQASHRIFGAKSNKSKNRWKERVMELQTKIAEQLEVLSVVSPEDAKLMREWKMFDQNASSPFFDPEWMFGVSSGFDIVIGNPPYHQISKDALATSEYKIYLKKRFQTSGGRLNTFIFFIHVGIEFLSSRGVMTYIIPNTILTQDYYKETRKLLLDKTIINKVVSYDKLPFENAVVENITFLCNKGECKNYNIDHYLCNIADVWYDTNKSKQYFLNNRTYSFNFQSNQLSDKLNINTTPLKQLCNINQAIALKGDKSLSVKYDNENNTYYKLLDGRNINKYSIAWSGIYLDYNIDRIHSCKSKVIFEVNEKLLFRRVSSKLIFTYDDSQYFALNTIVVVTANNCSTSLKYLLAILNSKVIDYYYISKHKSTKKVFSEIQARSVGELPIKLTGNQQLFTDLVDEILEAKKSDPTADTSALETEIDFMVYKLYGLTYDEVRIIDPKTPITQQKYEQ
ncbi:MAG: TaqI-like C-terminal specificity domain-containing protein [Bacteroides sp.]|uniref:Eco57I restriction-modification methylase domain-containing protein n=1 Tax=Bacteroides sp. TaxID=29523 RepID=UPI002FCB17B8